jgi:hypothetical protein
MLISARVWYGVFSLSKTTAYHQFGIFRGGAVKLDQSRREIADGNYTTRQPQ